jgi:hypothetical protein
MQIFQVPSVSFSHITKEDNQLLLDGVPIRNLLYFKANEAEYGFIIFVPDSEDILEDLEDSNLSRDFCNLLLWASENCFDFIRLDSCGDIVKKLNKNDW